MLKALNHQLLNIIGKLSCYVVKSSMMLFISFDITFEFIAIFQSLINRRQNLVK